jgi:uncharacterized protein (UPF0371 family)
MINSIGFDNILYLREQTAAILERVKLFGNKLYLEFGGKLLFDYHASLMHAASSVVINAIKKLSDIQFKIQLLPKNITEAIAHFKTTILDTNTNALNLFTLVIARDTALAGERGNRTL